MPKATASREPTRKELVNLPGGFVSLRKLNYGEILHRRDMAQNLEAPVSQDGSPTSMRVLTNNTALMLFDFERTILDHNLEDDNERKLNMADPNDVSNLDSQVAQEIEDFIEKMNTPIKESERAPLVSTSGKPSTDQAQASEKK